MLIVRFIDREGDSRIEHIELVCIYDIRMKHAAFGYHPGLGSLLCSPLSSGPYTIPLFLRKLYSCGVKEWSRSRSFFFGVLVSPHQVNADGHGSEASFGLPFRDIPRLGSGGPGRSLDIKGSDSSGDPEGESERAPCCVFRPS